MNSHLRLIDLDRPALAQRKRRPSKSRESSRTMLEFCRPHELRRIEMENMGAAIRRLEAALRIDDKLAGGEALKELIGDIGRADKELRDVLYMLRRGILWLKQDERTADLYEVLHREDMRLRR